MLTRRQFMKAAVMAGAAAAVPPFLESFLETARATGGSDNSGFFLTDPTRWATCKALCARIVPTGSDPSTDPGANEAAAVVFIDRFLAAFAPKAANRQYLPGSVADNPPIWVTGRWSGRNPYLGEGGYASDDYPADDFLTDSGQGRFLPLSPAQELSWRYQLYGEPALEEAPGWAQAWATQVKSGLIPTGVPAGGMQKAYNDGLDAFNSYSQSLFSTPFADASSEQQDLMLTMAGNVILNAVTGNVPVPSPPAAPPAASTLFPIITLHTFQATYGIPEYSWRNQDDDPTVERLGGTAQWRALGYDGDTQPLGNSLFDPNLYGPGEGPNEGFGAEPGSEDARVFHVFVPSGGYREFRPVSTLDEGGVTLSDADAVRIRQVLASPRRVK